jgi:hypothetical protein
MGAGSGGSGSGSGGGGGFWSGTGSQVLGMLGGIGQANRQYHRQKRLMGFQQQNQMALNQQGHDLQMDMWNKTNYGAQVKHMRDAGLNPALMYGSAGQGGTTGSQGGGSAAGGSAVGEKVMDMQNMLLGAQIDDLRASADEKRSKTGINEIEALLSQNDYDWLTNKNLSRQSTQVIKTIAELTGENYDEVLDQIDKRIGELLKFDNDVSETIKHGGITQGGKNAIKGARLGAEIKKKIGAGKMGEIVDEAIKGILEKATDIKEGIEKGFKNYKKNQNQ